jgi:hypothetical protein
MKKIIILIVVMVIGITSCMKDKGNYEYTDAEEQYPAAIVDFEAEYKLMAGDLIIISPEFEEDGVDDSKYGYLWFVDNGSGVRDTIGLERNLEYQVQQKAGEHTLHLKITNLLNDVSRNYSVKLIVQTEFSTGWFVTKETMGETDIDQVTYEGNRYVSNIIAMVNGRSIPGVPVKTIYATGLNGMGYEYMNPEGIVTVEPAFIVATNSEIWSVLADEMTEYYDTQELFLGPPATIAPSDMGGWADMIARFCVIINDGKIYWSAGETTTDGHIGQFSAEIAPEKNLDVNENVCKVYSNEIPGGMMPRGVMFFFDNNTRSFKRLYCPTMYFAPSPYAALTVQDIAPLEGYDLVYMKEYNTMFGLGILKSTVDGKYYSFNTINLVTTAAGGLANPFDSAPQLIPDGAVVSTASVRCTHGVNATIFSSSGNNEVYIYRIGSANPEKKVITLPAGEEVVFMQDIRDTDDEGNAFTHFVVLTNHDQGWTMRCYNYVDTDNLGNSPEPVKTYTGQGKASQVLYRSLTTASSF